jgi:membrane protein involved in colicin uptake
MWSIIKENPKAVIFAIAVHVIFVVVLVVSLKHSAPTVAVNPQTEIVKATVIDEGKIKRERERQAAKKTSTGTGA